MHSVKYLLFIISFSLSLQCAVIKQVCNTPLSNGKCDYPGTLAGLQSAVNNAAGLLSSSVIEIDPAINIDSNTGNGLILQANLSSKMIVIRTREWNIGNRMVLPSDAPKMATINLDTSSTNAGAIITATTTSGPPVSHYILQGIRVTFQNGVALQQATFISLAPIQSNITPGQEPADIWIWQCLLQGNQLGFGPAQGIYLQAKKIRIWQCYITDIGNDTSGSEAHGIAISTGQNNGDIRYNLVQGTMGFISGGGGGYPNFPSNPTMIPTGMFFAGDTFRLQARYRYRTYTADPHGLASAMPVSCVTGQSYYATDSQVYWLCPNTGKFLKALANIPPTAECFNGEFWKNSTTGNKFLCSGVGMFGTFTATLTDPNLPNAYFKNAHEIKKCAGCILLGNTFGPTFEQQVVSQFGDGTLINAIGCGQDGRWAVIRDINYISNFYLYPETLSTQGAPGPSSVCTDRVITLTNASGVFQFGETVTDNLGDTGTVYVVTPLVLRMEGAAVGNMFPVGSIMTGQTSGAKGTVATIGNNGPVFNQPPMYMNWKNNLAIGVGDPRAISGVGGSSGGNIFSDSDGLYTSSVLGLNFGTNDAPTTVAHNTVISNTVMISTNPGENPRTTKGFNYQATGAGVTAIDNIFPFGGYALDADNNDTNGTGCNNADGIINALLNNNVIINTPQNTTVLGWYSTCPAWQWLTTYAAASFTNPTVNDYSLAANSPVKGKAHDGTDPGADTHIVNCATATNNTGAYNPYHDFEVRGIQNGINSVTLNYTAYGLATPVWTVSTNPNLSNPLSMSSVIIEQVTGRNRIITLSGLNPATGYYYRITDPGSGCYINGWVYTQ